ncbi:MAG TPA: hypothetical protein DHV28_00065 [Ignavibacteriales bacterium]|nr:hypothetical protein [Ignavibacteriales bacterium]
MKNILQIASIKLLLLSCFLFASSFIIGQEKEFIGIKKIFDGNNISFQTVPQKVTSLNKSTEENPSISTSNSTDRYVLGGNVIWSFQDAAAIANRTELNGDGTVPLIAWGLNNMRVSRYTDVNNIPLWEKSTVPYDPIVEVSDDGLLIAATQGTDFYLLDNLNGSVKYQITMPDTLYATQISISRDRSLLVFLADAIGNGNTSVAFALNLTGVSPVIAWTLEVSKNEITNWAGVNISASGNRVVINGRNHLYVLNSNDGNVFWDHFVDNTEAPAVISGDGNIIVTADNSGFIQTRNFNFSTNQYDLLWQYRVPVGAFTNWASSVDISADGSTIVAGTLIFYSSGYDGSVIAFDTYGNGIPKWVYTGAGDLVDDIALSDDGKVAAAVTWGDLNHAKPDLFVFDVQTGDLAYEVVSPGSFFTVDISHDGQRVFAGGKAVHAREFGSGGLAYLVQVDLGGGNVSGTVTLNGSSNNGGVLLKAIGTQRTAVTDSLGNYIIKNIPAGTYTIKAEKPGYDYSEVNNVNVTIGNTTTGINFSLNQFLIQPPVLSASTTMPKAIMLSWVNPVLSLSNNRLIELAKAVGDIFEDEHVISTNYIVSKSNSNNTILTDNSSNGFIDSIVIYRSLVSGGPYSKIAVTSSTETSYNDSSVFPLRNYYYVINIFNSVGQSVYSNEVLGKVSDSLLTFNVVVPSGTIPTVNGMIEAGEWDDAFKLDVSDVFGFGGGVPLPQGSVYLYLKFNANTKMLYIAGEDFLNAALDDNEGFGLYFDDNNNNTFEPNGALSVLQEGNFWAYWHPSGSDLRFRKIFTGGGVGDVTTLPNAQVGFTDNAGYVQGEVAIPMGFNDGYELQVYGPDRTVGLGGFMIARNAGAAIFDGWWPQTMNSVFNPQYFGDVNIDIMLEAPPQIPSNISVNRQGNDLQLTFTDPQFGLNNEPLSSPPYKNIYKNGQFIITLAPGTQQYLDQNVECGLWYEYKLEAFTTNGTDTLMGPLSPAYGLFACSDPVLTQIKYDDDSWEAFYVVSFSFEENKFALRYSPTYYPARVVRLQTLVNGSGAFDFTVQADSIGFPGKVVAGPYRVSSGAPGSVAPIVLTLPGNEPPLFAEGDFWIVVNYLPLTPGEPGIGTDINPPISGRGMYYLTSTGWQNFSAGNLMISAYIAEQPVGIGNENFDDLPLTFGLMQNYPNPFNPSTVIKYQLPKNEFVTLEVFNAIGEKVNTLVNQIQNAGEYTVQWNGDNGFGKVLASGMYLYKIKAGPYTEIRKMLLLR